MAASKTDRNFFAPNGANSAMVCLQSESAVFIFQIMEGSVKKVLAEIKISVDKRSAVCYYKQADPKCWCSSAGRAADL